MSNCSLGDDWDELERKAAKCKHLRHKLSIIANFFLPTADKKTIEIKKTKGNDSDDSDARPKKKSAPSKAPAKGSSSGKKAPAKAPAKAPPKTNGKSAANGKKSAGKR